MQNIVLHILLVASLVGNGALAWLLSGSKGAGIEQKRIIAQQHELIKALSSDRITLHLHTEVKNTAVLGRVTSDANVDNYARQQAQIIKKELEAQWRPPLKK